MEKGWTNHNVLFVHARLDDSGIPYHAMRVFAHLRRRLGKRKSGVAAGIRRISRDCKMNVHSIEPALSWLEQHGLIKIQRKARKLHQYELLHNRKELYIDHRLDDCGLTPSQFRVLCHMSRLANERGEFFISERKFAKICGMKRETVHAALQALEDQGFFTPYVERKNPMCILTLDELFPKPTVAKTTNGGAPEIGISGMPERGNSEDSKRPLTTRNVSETGITPGPIRASPLPELGISGMPERGNVRLSFLRQSKEGNPKKSIQPLSQAQDANNASHLPSAVEQKTEELPPRASPKQPETADQMIERLVRENEFPGIDIPQEFVQYQQTPAGKNSSFNNRRFFEHLIQLRRAKSSLPHEFP
jgi:DNA-binding transcriptional regulator YhcF (GntR family)